MIGQTISHYRILEKLGEGGMGVVYKAEDTKLKRTVALKFLPPHLSASEQDKARFIQEAQAASALNHPNVCTIHDIQEHDTQMFIVMEFVDGQTLRDKKGVLSFKQAIEIGIQVADGLAAAHEKGIVHRDIKPENIMIRKDGIAQIMDFGLAKLRGAAGVSRLTKEGSTVGTAGYMSPEQVQGQDADHRSDIFSLGVLLYEMFTGQLPFKGVHETALAYEIVNVDALPMSTICPEIDPSLDGVVLGCLEKDPNERTQSVKQISVDLKRYKRESSRQRASRITAARPILRAASTTEQPVHEISRWRTLMWPIVSAVLVAALVLAVWAPWRPSPSLPDVVRFGLTLPKGESLDIVVYQSVTISSDGSRVVYRANGRLVLRSLNHLEPVPIPGTEGGGTPFFSPDGRWLGFFSGGKMKKVSLSGGAPLVLADAPDNRGATWGTDGTIVFAPAPQVGLMRIPEAGGQIQEITTRDTTHQERTHRWPSFLLDGKTVLFTVGVMDSPDYYEDATIEAVNIETGKRKVLITGASTARYVSSGHLLYSRSGVLFLLPFDVDNIEVTGSPVPVVDGLNGDPTSGAMHYALSQNGTLAYIPGQIEGADRSLVLLDQSGTATPIAAAPAAYMEPRISPDGKRIALVVGAGKDFDIWVYDISRGTLSRLTFGGTNRTPTWSPDGKRIAYWVNLGDLTQSGISVKPADGSGETEKLLTGFGRSYIDCWARDGSMLILDKANQGSQSDIYVMPMNGDRKPWPFVATKFDEWQGALSPDGKWLAYISNESGIYQVYVQSFPAKGGKWQISAEGGLEPHWAADGRTLYYINGARMMAVSLSTAPSFAAGQPKVLFDGYRALPVDSGISYDLTPDGKYFVTTKPKREETFQQVTVVLNLFTELRGLMSTTR